jgi:hypothetical protein
VTGIAQESTGVTLALAGDEFVGLADAVTRWFGSG